MRKAALVLALFALLASSVPAAAVVNLDGRHTSAVADQQPNQQLGIDPDPETTMTIHLQQDTDARWAVTVRYELDTANETRAFRTVAREFEEGDLNTGFDARLFSNIANVTAERTGRDMRVTNVTRESNVSAGVGTLTLEFTWTNFLERTGEGTLRLGDALWTGRNRSWLSSLEGNQRLVVENPPGYDVPTSNYRIENNTLVFEGPFEFDKRPSVVYEQASNPEPPTQNVPWALVAGGIVLAGGIVAVALYLVRRQGSEPVESEAEATPEPVDRGRARDDRRPAENGSGARADEPSHGGTAGSTPGGVTAEPPETGENEVDLELLSDEERVEHLLEQNGGRMRQANIVKETGWSDAKVSQLLSSMADDGRVDKLRLGRENLISLPDEENDEA
jgi:hypothetical protein